MYSFLCINAHAILIRRQCFLECTTDSVHLSDYDKAQCALHSYFSYGNVLSYQIVRSLKKLTNYYIHASHPLSAFIFDYTSEWTSNTSIRDTCGRWSREKAVEIDAEEFCISKRKGD